MHQDVKGKTLPSQICRTYRTAVVQYTNTINSPCTAIRNTEQSSAQQCILQHGGFHSHARGGHRCTPLHGYVSRKRYSRLHLSSQGSLFSFLCSKYIPGYSSSASCKIFECEGKKCDSCSNRRFCSRQYWSSITTLFVPCICSIRLHMQVLGVCIIVFVSIRST